jgi:hypothetical protein
VILTLMCRSKVHASAFRQRALSVRSGALSYAVGIVPEPPSSRGENRGSHPARSSHRPLRIDATRCSWLEQSGRLAVDLDSLLELAPS